MSMIKVSCPSCKSALKIAEEKLMETQGRVVCHECQHIFRLVKKSKKNGIKKPANLHLMILAMMTRFFLPMAFLKNLKPN